MYRHVEHIILILIQFLMMGAYRESTNANFIVICFIRQGIHCIQSKYSNHSTTDYVVILRQTTLYPSDILMWTSGLSIPLIIVSFK